MNSAISLSLHQPTPTAYRLNRITKVCEKRTLKDPFRPLAVPSNATFYGEAYIGTGAFEGGGILVNNWGGQNEYGG